MQRVTVKDFRGFRENVTFGLYHVQVPTWSAPHLQYLADDAQGPDSQKNLSTNLGKT